MCEFRVFGMDKGKIDLKIQNKAQTLPFANPVKQETNDGKSNA
jgi:hypothetical protein